MEIIYMKVFIVPATYNEKGNIERLITIMEEEVFPKIKNHNMYILVADDNSPDGTADAVRELMKKYKNLDVNVGEKKGLGASYLRAMSYAIEKKGADVVISIDADLQHDPHSITDFLKEIDNGYDIVTSTRYSKGGSMPKNWPLYRKIFSVGANTVARVLTGRFHLHDWTGGFRAYRKEVFLKEREKLKSFSGYTFQAAALYKSLLDGYKITEVPIHFRSRKIGDSKIAPAEYIYNFFTYIFIERIRELRRFIQFLVVGGTGFIVQILSQEIAVILGVAHALAAGIGAEAAILSNFILNHLWTFQDTHHLKENASFLTKLAKFNMTSLLSIFLQIAAVWLGDHFLGVNIYIAGFQIPTRIFILFPTIIFLVIPLNYFIYNKVIWKTQHLKKK